MQHTGVKAGTQRMAARVAVVFRIGQRTAAEAVQHDYKYSLSHESTSFFHCH
jgi:hypothetical protein